MRCPELNAVFHVLLHQSYMEKNCYLPALWHGASEYTAHGCFGLFLLAITLQLRSNLL